MAYDQLGCGTSSCPADPSLRETLGLGKVHLLGQSWGGWLSIEYGVTFPQNLKTIILENTCGDMPHLVSELNRLRRALGAETEAVMQQHNLKDWNRIPDMHRITAPALITVGKHDELTPACALRMKQALPNADLVVFPKSSHTPFYEEPDSYLPGIARLPRPPPDRLIPLRERADG